VGEDQVLLARVALAEGVVSERHVPRLDDNPYLVEGRADDPKTGCLDVERSSASTRVR